MRAGAYTSIFTLTRRKLVLVEDFPNILHPAVRSRFHDALRAHVERSWDVAPLVLVISDAGLSAEGSSNGGRGRDLVIDVRTVVPPESSSTSLFTEIRFVHLYDSALFPYRADRCAIDSIRSHLRYSLPR
jgi:cell cycle checkpoint protein